MKNSNYIYIYICISKLPYLLMSSWKLCFCSSYLCLRRSGGNRTLAALQFIIVAWEIKSAATKKRTLNGQVKWFSKQVPQAMSKYHMGAAAVCALTYECCLCNLYILPFITILKAWILAFFFPLGKLNYVPMFTWYLFLCNTCSPSRSFVPYLTLIWRLLESCCC